MWKFSVFQGIHILNILDQKYILMTDLSTRIITERIPLNTCGPRKIYPDKRNAEWQCFYRTQFEDNTINMASANDVVKIYSKLITQSCESVCNIRQIKLQKTKYKALGWFDTAYRMARAAGHMCYIDVVKTCKNYSSAKQRKNANLDTNFRMN